MDIKFSIVITTQRACLVLSYYKNTTLATGSKYLHMRYGLIFTTTFLPSMLKTTPPRPVNAGLNGKNVFKIFFLSWISMMRHANTHFFCTNWLVSIWCLSEHFTPQRNIDDETYLFRQARQRNNQLRRSINLPLVCANCPQLANLPLLRNKSNRR